MIRIAALAAGVIAFFVAVRTEMSLVALLLAAYGAVVQLAPLAVATFFWKRATPAGALAGLVVGALVTLVLTRYPQCLPYGIHAGVVGLLVNTFTLVAVSLITRPLPDEHVSNFLDVSRRA